jgi:RNA polymerase sigma-70 factor (ECF subfamily)
LAFLASWRLDKFALLPCQCSEVTQQHIRRLYEQHRRGLLAYACSLSSSFSSAEDVLHQVFERLLRGDIEITGEPAPYLYRAVRNAALNSLRHQTREVELDDGWLDGPAGMEETALELQSALRELPEEQREVILLHVWGQMSFEETATALGISPNTAASRYRYALSKLREQFKATARNGYGLAK